MISSSSFQMSQVFVVLDRKLKMSLTHAECSMHGLMFCDLNLIQERASMETSPEGKKDGLCLHCEHAEITAINLCGQKQVGAPTINLSFVSMLRSQ